MSGLPPTPRPSCAAFLFLLLLFLLLHQGGGHEPASRKSSIEFPLKRKLFIRFNLFIQPVFSRTALGEKARDDTGACPLDKIAKQITVRQGFGINAELEETLTPRGPNL